MSSDAVLDRLTHLHPKLIDLSLDRVEALLDDLGRPHEALPPVVHVAGTNGKGSVIAFLRAILEAAGLRVHTYTSPHLVRFNERIRVAGEIIGDAELTALLEECERVNGDRPITFFEITTAAAFLAFARTRADVALLETGLGGRLDATNTVRKPALTVITPISLDHQHYLGDTIEKIAAEKAGILKPDVPCLSSTQTRKAARVLTDRAGELGVPLRREGADWFVMPRGETMLYAAGERTRELPLPALPGKHQLFNAGLAVACAEALDGLDIPKTAYAEGMRAAVWPARLQRLTKGPLVEMLPEGWELWLDGGHNPAAGKILGEHSRRWRDKPLYLVTGMITGKDPIGFLKPLEGAVRRLHGVTIPDEAASLPAEKVVLAAQYLAIDAAPASSVAEAVRGFVEKEPGPARILICGSLYLAGHVLRNDA